MPYFLIARTDVALIAGILSFAIVIDDTNGPIFNNFVRVLPIVFVTMSGFVINDIFDLEKDRSAGLKRMLVTGELDKVLAIIYSIALSFLAILTEFMVGTFISFVMIFTTWVLVLLYSWMSRWAPFVKNFYTALLCCSPILYSSSITFQPISIWVYFVLFCFIAGRELLLDVADFRTDIDFGIKTLPFYLGTNFSTRIGWMLMWCSLIILTVLSESIWSLTLTLVSAIWMLICLSMYSNKPRIAVALTRISMLLGAFSFALAS